MARVRYPSRDSRASFRADSSAGTAGRCDAGAAPSAGTASATATSCASSGVRLPLRRLQGEQAATTLSQVVWPPRERGSRWSKVRSSRVAAILAGEAVAQEDVEPREGRMGRWLHEGLERDHARQLHLEGRAVHRAVVIGDDVHAFEEHRLDRVLPGPQRQRIIAQRPKVRVEHQGRKSSWRNVHVQATLLDLLECCRHAANTPSI